MNQSSLQEAFGKASAKRPAARPSSPGARSRAGRADPPAKKHKAKASHAVPNPTVNIVRTLADLTPEGGIKHGEDGVYVDRRPGMRDPIHGFPRFVVIGGHIFPNCLTATSLPEKRADRVDGGLYALPCGRFARWSAKGRKLNLQCPWCVFYDNGVATANYSHEEGEGAGEGTSVCQGCRDAAGFDKVLQRPCVECEQREAHYPSADGAKNKLCKKCAEKEGTYAPKQHRRCDHGTLFDLCTKGCCPDDKLNKRICTSCRERQVRHDAYKAGVRMCTTCLGGAAKVKHKENAVAKFLLDNGFQQFEGDPNVLPPPMHFKREHFVKFDCAPANSTSNATTNPATSGQIDFIININGTYVFLEVDESQHKFGYKATLSCDFKRMTDVHATICIAGDARMGQPYWMRFNPDTWHVDGVSKPVPIEVRHRCLLEAILSVQPCDHVRTGYLFYDLKDGELHVLQNEEYHETFRQHAVNLTDPGAVRANDA